MKMRPLPMLGICWAVNCATTTRQYKSKHYCTLSPVTSSSTVAYIDIHMDMIR